ncbi:MAG: hypothetical protein IPG06_07605 [Haliea sp.]|nr:hypothetical protein [Haliea sp.]
MRNQPHRPVFTHVAMLSLQGGVVKALIPAVYATEQVGDSLSLVGSFLSIINAGGV